MRLPQFRLALKLWLALFLSTTVVVIGMVALMRASFDRDFKKHIHRVANEQIEYLAPRLERHFSRDNNFDHLKNSPRRWNKLERASWIRALGIAADNENGIEAENENNEISTRDEANRERDSRRPPPARPIRTPTNLVLANANKELIIGNPMEENPVLKWQALTVNKEIVGYLGFSVHRHSGSQRELRFLQRQSNNFLLFGLFALLASGAFALPIAAFLVRPIKKLQSATENLSHGDFKTRVTVSGNDELAQLGQHFNHLAKTLEDNEHQRRRWVADISHELRTPVTFIKGQIESFVDGIRKTDKKNLLALEKQINQLNKLINDLYQLSLSELGALNYKKSDQLVCPIIDSIITSVGTAYHNKALDLKVNNSLPEQYSQFLDPDRLEQLLLNLLTNSLRYTDTPGLVSLTCYEKDHALTLIVEDTPPGVPEHDLPHLFESLYRSENSRNRDYGGAGIGLAICQNIINAHNGTITAEASKCGGLKIVCTLPTSRSYE